MVRYPINRIHYSGQDHFLVLILTLSPYHHHIHPHFWEGDKHLVSACTHCESKYSHRQFNGACNL